MGRKSREHRERRERRARSGGVQGEAGRKLRIADLERQLKNLCEDAVTWSSMDMPPDVQETNLEDVIAFESVGSGPSLFEGLQERGLELPPPDQLTEHESAQKAKEVLFALAKIRVFVVGFSHMSARELYRTLWHETLWEGCYVEKRNPYAHTIIDVSHRMSRSDWLEWLEGMKSESMVH